ncbi:MAG TPA: hypothetical protein VII72_23095 [Myxococcota bacterium]
MAASDPLPHLRRWAESVAANGGIAGFALPGDERRTLTARMQKIRQGPARVRYEIRLHSNVQDAETTVYFDVESPFALETPARADAALLVALFPALHHGGTLRVEGTVSPLLLRNLLDLQAIWFRARPDRYRPFRVDVDALSDAVPASASDRAILPLSGGLDSLLALCQHSDPKRPLGPAAAELGACLFLPGFTPPLQRRADFPLAIDTVRRTAAMRGLPLVVAETNFGEVVHWRDDSHGALLAAGLTLLSPHFRHGIIASSMPHVFPSFPVWGSAAASDPFLSSDGFEIRDHGADVDRCVKAAAIARHPEMLGRLVVCFQVPGMTGNCGRCEKCIRTMLSFLAAGVEIPKLAFPSGLDPKRVPKKLRGKLEYARPTLELAEASGIEHPALRSLRRAYRRHLAKYRLRSAITRALPWVDLLEPDGFPPQWLIPRRARAAARRDRGLSWRAPRRSR